MVARHNYHCDECGHNTFTLSRLVLDMPGDRNDSGPSSWLLLCCSACHAHMTQVEIKESYLEQSSARTVQNRSPTPIGGPTDTLPVPISSEQPYKLQRPKPPKMRPAQLSHCIHCGEGVAPYQYSTTEYSFPYKSSLFPADERADNIPESDYYYCDSCQQKHQAPSLLSTSFGCPTCRAFMPFVVGHCGYCGTRIQNLEL